MLDIAVFATAFILVFFSEMGDKTQMVAVSLASRHDHRMVFTAVFSALFAATVLAVAAGAILWRLVDIFYLQLLSGVLFIIFGIWTLLDCEEEEEPAATGFFQAFILVFFSEMGDKTQIAIVALVAATFSFTHAVMVFVGAVAAFALATMIAVYAGRALGSRINRETMEKAGGAMFLAFGAAILLWLFIPGLPSI